MATLTLGTIRNMVRSELNEITYLSISNDEISGLVNDGIKDISVKALCYESLITKSNIPKSARLISLAGDNIININSVSYAGKTEIGMECVIPQKLGHIPINGYTPQFWFKWGNYLIIEPLPDVATYSVYIFASCYPTSVILNDGDFIPNLPVEFHECVYLYTLTYSCFKLKRWQEGGEFYNRYVESVQMKKFEYVMKATDYDNTDIPAKVSK